MRNNRVSFEWIRDKVEKKRKKKKKEKNPFPGECRLEIIESDPRWFREKSDRKRCARESFRFGAYVPEENGVIVYFARCIVDRNAFSLSLSLSLSLYHPPAPLNNNREKWSFDDKAIRELFFLLAISLRVLSLSLSLFVRPESFYKFIRVRPGERVIENLPSLYLILLVNS